MISAATDQTIRVWDTSTWTEAKVLRGHTDEVHGLALSEAAQLIASASKDGNLMLWTKDGKSAADGYRRLPEESRTSVQPLDHRAWLLLPRGPSWSISSATPLRCRSDRILHQCPGLFGTNLLCLWNGTNQILVRELRGAEFVQRGAITLDSGLRPMSWITTPRASSWRGPTLLVKLGLRREPRRNLAVVVN